MSVMLYYRVFTGVCHSVHGGVRQTSPWANTPLGRHPPRQTHPQADIHPWANTPLGRHPLGRHTPIQTSPSDSYCSGLECIPTGMHSCSYFCFCFCFLRIEKNPTIYRNLRIYIFIYLFSVCYIYIGGSKGTSGVHAPPGQFLSFSDSFRAE